PFKRRLSLTSLSGAAARLTYTITRRTAGVSRLLVCDYRTPRLTPAVRQPSQPVEHGRQDHLDDVSIGRERDREAAAVAMEGDFFQRGHAERPKSVVFLLLRQLVGGQTEEAQQGVADSVGGGIGSRGRDETHPRPVTHRKSDRQRAEGAGRHFQF